MTPQSARRFDASVSRFFQLPAANSIPLEAVAYVPYVHRARPATNPGEPGGYPGMSASHDSDTAVLNINPSLQCQCIILVGQGGPTPSETITSGSRTCTCMSTVHL